MYEKVRQGIKKTKDAIPTLRAFKRAAMLGTVLPTGDSLDTFLPTFLYIATVSLLDDALDEFICANYPGTKPGKLSQMLFFLEQQGRLNDPQRLSGIKDARNKYAHEPGEYGTWDELTALLADLDIELHHLGVL